MSGTSTGRIDGEQPLALPMPGPLFRRLDLRQSTIASAIGIAAGAVVAAAVIVAIAVEIV